MIAETFTSLARRHTEDTAFVQSLWTELVKCYSEKGRHYHTLDHLDALLTLILPISDQFQDLDALLFALYYHDVVYNVLKKNNEEKSATLAEKRLGRLNFQPERIGICKKHILATKHHQVSDDPDTNLFTDADLSILGQDWPTYKFYAERVRKEFSIYPDLIYKPGRKKVLEHFLQMTKIYKTATFLTKFEYQARLNLKRELDELMQ